MMVTLLHVAPAVAVNRLASIEAVLAQCFGDALVDTTCSQHSSRDQMLASIVEHVINHGQIMRGRQTHLRL